MSRSSVLSIAPVLLLASLPGCASHRLPDQEPATAAPTERTGIVHRGDTPYTLVGTPITVGQRAPDGVLRGEGFAPVPVNFADGTSRVVLLVPSLDTPTCSMEARTFNGDASDLGEGVEVLIVSRDLPPAQARFCAAEGIERVRMLSDYVDGGFGRSWGLFVKETALEARAVAVLDGEGIVRYLQVVPNIPDEPDYAAALTAVKALAPRPAPPTP